MPSAFQLAISQLAPAEAATLQGVFTLWTNDISLAQTTTNIADETALALADFVALLRAFAGALVASTPPHTNEWKHACRLHKFKGRRLPAAQCPSVLGRAKSLQGHADSIEKASGGALPASVAKRQLIKQGGQPRVDTVFAPFLYGAPLDGNHLPAPGAFNLVWATFDSTDPAADPFANLPSRASVLTALGLGHLDPDETLILLVWDHAASGSPSLYRPTVADAEDSSFYRPHPDSNERCGWTCPLSPNPDNFPAFPEVVLPEPTSKGLRLPFHLR